MSDSYLENNMILNADGQPVYKLVDSNPAEYAAMFEKCWGSAPIIRVGFRSPVPKRHLENADYVHDARPIAWPVYHPYYITASSETHMTLMAYVESEQELLALWPEATDITVFETNVASYRYNSRFPKPDWIDEVQSPEFTVAPHRVGAVRIYPANDPETNLIFATGDIDYQVQLNNNRLEYGAHENTEFQSIYDQLDAGWRDLVIEITVTETLEAAEIAANKLKEFWAPNEEIQTTVHF